MTRAVFFGTPASAVPALLSLGEVAEPILVVTRPDRPRGRSGRPRPSAVKEAALARGWPLAQPERVGEIEGRLERLAPDVGVVVAYGQLIPGRALAVASAGMVNVHFSLLPRWRGAAPVPRAILAGDRETGVTLMLMDEGLDTGPILARRSTPIRADDTAGTVTDRLAGSGAELLRSELPRYLAGELEALPQDEEAATYAPKVTPEEARLDPARPAEELGRMVRAFNPRPGCWGEVEGERFKVWGARPDRVEVTPGRLELVGDRLVLGTGEGALELLEVQPAGGRRMSGEAWGRGRRGEPARLS